MENQKFITEREKTIIKKDRFGWSGETYVKLRGYCYIVTTFRRNSGITSEAMQINDEGASKGCFSFSFNPLTAKRYHLGNEIALATEAKVRELHLKALAIFDQMSDQLPGPSINSVKKITSKYEDHCTDITGDFRDYSPSLFNEIFGGCNFIFENRKWSPETEQKFTEWAASTSQIESNRKAKRLFYECDIPTNEYIITPEGTIQSILKEAENPEKIEGVKISRNTEKDGIEISFETKPDAKIIESLKKAGFRWSGYNRVWWAKYSDALMEVVKSIVI